MGLTATNCLSLAVRSGMTVVVLLLTGSSCHNRDGRPTRDDACIIYCNWAAKCVADLVDDVQACRDACSIELESCSDGDEYNAIGEIMDCDGRSCVDSCTVDEGDDCMFVWPP